MTASAVVVESVARAAAVAAVATIAAPSVAPWLGRSAGRWAIAALLVAPGLMIGHVWATHAPDALVDPAARNWLYAALSIARSLPVAAVVWWLVPARESAAARHVARLGAVRRGVDRRRFGATAAIVFVHAFAEFEIAARLAVSAWPVAVFDAHAGGLALGESLVAVSIPASVSLVALVAAAVALGRRHARTAAVQPAPRVAGGLVLAAAVVANVVAPLVWLVPDAWAGFAAVARRAGPFASELGASLGVAVVAAVAADAIAGLAVRRPAVGFALAVPGLLGALVPSLLAIAAMQSVDGALYDTPIAWVCVATACLVPLAFVLRLAIARDAHATAVHTARLLAAGPSTRATARAIRWSLVGRARLGVLVVVALVGSYEVTAASLLAPTGMTPATVRLYNLMHYERSQALSAMLVVAVCVPLIALAVGGTIARRALEGRRNG